MVRETIPRKPFAKYPVMFGPNITGEFTAVEEMNNVTGAFRVIYQSQPSKSGNHNSGQRIQLNASRSAQIFGRTSTVQPPAIALLPCIKT